MKLLMGGLMVFAIAALGFDWFEGFELILGMLVLFPAIFIFGTIFLGKKIMDKEVDDEIKKQDRFSKWE